MNKTISLLLLFAVGVAAQTKDTASRGLASVVFANLGTPANGTIVYCSDCTAANPAASGGSGAVARRENGAWNSGGGAGGALSASSLYLKLNEASGTALTDSSGNSRSCTLTAAHLPTWDTPRGLLFAGAQSITCTSAAPDWFASIRTVHIFSKLDISTARGSTNVFFTLVGDANLSVSIDFWNAREAILGIYEGTFESNVKSDNRVHDYAVVFGNPPQFFIDGVPTTGSLNASINIVPGASGGSIFIGAATGTGTYGMYGPIYSVYMKTTTDSKTTVASDYAALAYDLSSSGVLLGGPIAYPGTCILFDGDSWLNNDHNGKAYSTSMISKFGKLYGQPLNAWNFGVNGFDWASAAGRQGTPYSVMPKVCSASASPPVYYGRLGYNDVFYASTAPATVFTSAQTAYTARVADGYAIVAHTVLACAAAADNCGTNDANRLTYNNSIQNGFIAAPAASGDTGTLVVGSKNVGVDYAGFDPVMGVNGVTQNNSNFWNVDQYHINPSGEDWLMDYMVAAVKRATKDYSETCSTITVDTPNDGTIWRVAKNGGGNGKAAAITAGLTQSLNLFYVGPGFEITRTMLKSVTAFAGTATLGLKVGDSVGGAGYYDNTSYDLKAAVANGNIQQATPSKSKTWAGSYLTLDFTATTNNLTLITAGSVNLMYCVVPTSMP